MQFPQQLATQHWKMFLMQLPRWGVTPCNVPEQLATICAEKAWWNLLLACRGQWLVGFTKKSMHAQGKLRCKLLEGCYTVQRQLQVATIVAKSRTRFYFVQRCAQQKKMRCKLLRYPSNSSATCNGVAVKIAQCNMAFSVTSAGQRSLPWPCKFSKCWDKILVLVQALGSLCTIYDGKHIELSVPINSKLAQRK